MSNFNENRLQDQKSESVSLPEVLQYFIDYEKMVRYREGSLTNKSGSDYPESMKENGREIQEKLIEKYENEVQSIIRQKLKDKNQLNEAFKQELREIIKAKDIVAFAALLENLYFFRANEDRQQIRSQFEQLILDDSFIICDCIIEKYENGSRLKIPGLIFNCRLVADNIEIEKYAVNYRALLIVMSAVLDIDLEILELDYQKEMQQLCEELNSCVNQKEIPKIIDFIDETIRSRYPKGQLGWKEFSEHRGWKRTCKIYITHEEISEIMEPIFRKEMENICNLLKDSKVEPKLLEKYILGSENSCKFEAFDSIMETNLLAHAGSYTSLYPVNFKQWNVVQLAQKAKLLAVSGPPGTGKTTLLKEIIANEIVQKALIVAESWNTNWIEKKYKQNENYSVIPNINKLSRHSIVVSSTNNAAVDNIGNELAKEIGFCKDIIAAGLVESEEDTHTGTFCGQMGNKKNFEEKFITYLKSFICGLPKVEVNKDNAEKIYKDFILAYKKLQQIDEKFSKVILCRKAFKKLLEDIVAENAFGATDYTTICESIEKNLICINLQLEELKEGKRKNEVVHLQIKNQIELIMEKNNYNRINVGKIDVSITQLNIQRENLKSDAEKYKERKKWGWIATFWPAWKEFFKRYPSLSCINDDINSISINISEQEKDMERIEQEIISFKKAQEELENNIITLYDELKNINKNIKKLENKCSELNKASELLEQVRQNFIVALQSYCQTDAVEITTDTVEMINLSSLVELDEKEFDKWHELANGVGLLKLRNDLFEQALLLIEQYILRNRDQIIKNFELIRSGDKWFKRFYNPSETYALEQVECLHALWNTIFLCFPVITCTLHSFKSDAGNFKQLVPDVIGLLLIDEAGQILPHYLCGPLFRSQRAILVGDVAQIEPVRTPGAEIIDDVKFSNFREIEKNKIRINENSAQTYANRGSDYREEMQGRIDGILLEEHRRCEASIIEYSNKYVYFNKLKVFKKDSIKGFFGKNLLAMDVRGPKNKNVHINMTEIDFCANILPDLKKEYGDSIAVITPFRAQANAIEKRLGVAAGTVHRFQGQEKDCIIFSLVLDSLEKQRGLAEFIGKTENMLNVALSRAKKQFIVVGNINIMKNSNNQLGNLYKILRDRGRIVSMFSMEQNADLDDCEIGKMCQYMATKPLDLNDSIGKYIENKFPRGVIGSAEEHKNFLKIIVSNMQNELLINSPWILEEVGSNTIIDELEKQSSLGKTVKIYYGYRKISPPIPSEGITNPKFFQMLLNADYSSDKYREKAKKAIDKLYKILGENLVYKAPTHAKILVIDNKYAVVGSYNWLSGGNMLSDRNEASCIITDEHVVRYLKEEILS